MERCLCGASDCPRCYPLSWKDSLFDEMYDDEEEEEEEGEEVSDDHY